MGQARKQALRGPFDLLRIDLNHAIEQRQQRRYGHLAMIAGLNLVVFADENRVDLALIRDANFIAGQ